MCGGKHLRLTFIKCGSCFVLMGLAFVWMEHFTMLLLCTFFLQVPNECQEMVTILDLHSSLMCAASNCASIDRQPIRSRIGADF